MDLKGLKLPGNCIVHLGTDAVRPLFDILQPAEQLLGRTIQPTLYRTQEFAEKKDTEFMRRIFDAPTISVVDVINEQRK